MVDNPKIGEKYYFAHYWNEGLIDLGEITEIWREKFVAKAESGETYFCAKEELYSSKEEAKKVLISQYEKIIQIDQENLERIKNL